MDDLDDDDGGGGGGDAAWMATFADLSTLLLTFFVLLLSFANMDITAFRMALGSVREALGVQFEHPGDMMGKTTSPVELSKEESTTSIPLFDEMQLLARVLRKAQEGGVEDHIEAEVGERGVLIRVKGQLLFATGDADLRKEGQKTLEAIAEIANEITYPVLVEGHTDDRPISTSRYPSNWELSTARATSTLRFLASAGVAVERLGVAGYADMKPLAPNDTEENRSRNRRVEFVFLTPAEDIAKREIVHNKLGASGAAVTERQIGPSPPMQEGERPANTPEGVR